jgi:hypothetical protein
VVWTRQWFGGGPAPGHEKHQLKSSIDICQTFAASTPVAVFALGRDSDATETVVHGEVDRMGVLGRIGVTVIPLNSEQWSSGLWTHKSACQRIIAREHCEADSR